MPFVYFQLISHVEEEGLDAEGLLRIPGSATRVKVFCCMNTINFQIILH